MVDGVRERLGTMRLVTNSLALLFGRPALFLVVLLFSVLVMAVAGSIFYALFGGRFIEPYAGMAAVGDSFVLDPALLRSILPAYLGLALVMMLAIAFIILLFCYAYKDAHDGRPARFGYYLGQSLRRYLPMLLVSLAMFLLYIASAVLVMIPVGAVSSFFAPANIFLIILVFVAFYVWFAGAFAPVFSACAFESVSIKAIVRSFQLSKGYRWKIGFGLVLLSIIAMIVTLLIIAVGALLAGGFSMLGGVGELVGGVLLGLLTLTGYAIAYASMIGFGVLVYERLKEVKGGGSEEIAEVFA